MGLGCFLLLAVVVGPLLVTILVVCLGAAVDLIGQIWGLLTSILL
jgi:hypothetical protein